MDIDDPYARKAINSKDYLEMCQYDWGANEAPSPRELALTEAVTINDAVTFQLGEDRYIISAAKKGSLKIECNVPVKLPKKRRKASKK